MERTITFNEIALSAGFTPGPDGKLNLPATQDTANLLAQAATDMVGEWKPGDDRVILTLTGAGPVWGYLVIVHALHGRVARLIYSAPNAEIVVFSHGI